MKRVLKMGLIVVIVVIVMLAGFAFYMSRGLEAGKNLDIGGIDLTNVEDGTYTGKHDDGRFSNEVSVTVKDHRITDIRVIKDVTFAKPDWRDDLLARVIEKQDTGVDIVSGATVTSKAYMKSIENALKGN